MKTLIVIAAALLGGCVIFMTPAELREMGVRTTFQSSNLPEQTAHCLARNGENQGLLARVLPFPSSGGFEVVFSQPMANGGVNNMLLIEARPAAQGTTGTLYMHTLPLFKDEFRAAVLKGC